MAEIAGFNTVDDDQDRFKTDFSDFNPKVHLTEREDGETILKTKSIQIPPLHTFFSNKTLVGKASYYNVTPDVEQPEGVDHGHLVEGEKPIEENPLLKPVAEQLQAIDHEHFAAVEKAIEENPISSNYLIEVQVLVGKILAQLSRIAEKDRHQMEEMKSKYKKSTLESSNLQREFGAHNLKFALISFGASFLQFLSPHQSDREIANIFAKECCPKLGEMFGSSIQANMNQANSIASLLLQEFQAKSTKGSSDAGNKQEIIELLNKVLNSLKEAARAG